MVLGKKANRGTAIKTFLIAAWDTAISGVGNLVLFYTVST
jgi:hypothetical protein